MHQNGAPTWRLHTKLYKGAWNVSANNSETIGHKDLRLGQNVYILVFYNISLSWLLPLDGFQFNFLLRDCENDLYNNILFPYPYFKCYISQISVPQMQLQVIPSHFTRRLKNADLLNKSKSLKTVISLEVPWNVLKICLSEVLRTMCRESNFKRKPLKFRFCNHH